MKLLDLGATGLVGSHLLRQASRDTRIDRIVAPVRRDMPITSKLQPPRIDFGQPPEEAEWWAADACICALGTTRRRAGSAAAFRHVDHDIVLSLAHLVQIAARFGIDLANSAMAGRATVRENGRLRLAVPHLGTDGRLWQLHLQAYDLGLNQTLCCKPVHRNEGYELYLDTVA